MEIQGLTPAPTQALLPAALRTRIKPIPFLKANAAQVLRDLAANQTPLVITQNGEAAAVLQDVRSFEKNQETMALLKILALGNAQIEKGRVATAAQAFGKVRTKRHETSTKTAA